MGLNLAYLGDVLIFSTAVFLIFSTLFYLLAWRGKDKFTDLARKLYYISTALISTAIAVLLYLILTHDFTVAYIYSYSSTDLPLGYLISTLWGGQEGTFLLWVFFTSLLGIIMLRTAGSFEKGNMFFVNIFLLSIIVILIKKSPFELLPVFRTEGAGLNPLLQNFWMQIHPPIMFIGFSGAVFPFAFAMTGLVERKYTQWAESAKRWTVFAWLSLGVSLVMGGYWAYVTLGWGGFWAWDPVENSSFIPWIFLAAQIHVLFINRLRRGLMRFSLFMVCLSFWSVLYGTFLTRSGILADFSVHSFVDLGLNNYLAGGLLLFVFIGLALIVFRWRDIPPNKAFSQAASKSYMVTLGILLLFVGGILTLIGTSAPLLTRFNDTPSAVGLQYYFATMTPIAIGVMLLLGVFPAFKWNNGLSKPRLLLSGTIIGIVTIAGLLITGFTYELMYLLFFGTAAMAITSNILVLYLSYAEQKFVPGYLAHIGIAIAMVGAGLSAGFETKKTVVLPQNEVVTAMGYEMKFTKMVDNPKGFDCHVEITSEGDSFVAVLPHEFPKNQEGVMRKPYVKKYLTYDVYVAPVGMEQKNGNDPSVFEFAKGETINIDKYKITFHNYELTSYESGAATAGAKISIVYDGITEEIIPMVKAEGDSVLTKEAFFDHDKGRVSIAGIAYESGSVLLQIIGDFTQPEEFAQANLVIELSEKPFINLFWFGTFLCFFSGGLSLRKQKRRKKGNQAKYIEIHDSKKAMVS